jgi:hypothetical protein
MLKEKRKQQQQEKKQKQKKYFPTGAPPKFATC